MQRLRIDPREAAPIWRQVEDGVRQLVGGGVWPPGAAAPSVRALAAELLINPATVAKAYQRLVDDGVLVVKRGEGTFVAAQPPVPTRAARLTALRQAADRYVAAATAQGAEAGEAIVMIREAFDRAPRGYAVEGGKR
jgi:GntR family transcriptional regulator